MNLICPHCGKPLTTPAELDPGIIRAEAEAEPIEQFSRIRLEDLNGDPYHDWSLIVARFQYSLPDLIEVIMEDKGRFLKGKQAEAEPQRVAGPSQLWQDLDAIRPHLSKIVQNGQFVYGHQSRIAEALGVPNSGSYRRRIQNVAHALQRTVVKSSTTAPGQAAPPQPGEKRQAA